jgi:hypothetical protein
MAYLPAPAVQPKLLEPVPAEVQKMRMGLIKLLLVHDHCGYVKADSAMPAGMHVGVLRASTLKAVLQQNRSSRSNRIPVAL